MTNNFVNVLKRSGFLFGAIPIFGLATGALFPLVALELDSRGFKESFVGTATSFYYLGSFIGVLSFGRVLRLAGYRLAFAMAAAAAAAATFGLRESESAVEWAVLRFAGGYALGSYYVVVDSWVAALADRQTRGRLVALYESLRLSATALGPSLLVVGTVQASLTLVAFAYAVSVLPAFLNPTPTIREITPLRFDGVVELARCFPPAITLVFCGGLTTASFYGLSAIYASQMGLAAGGIALFVGIVLVAPVLTEVPFGALADRFTRMRVAAPAALMALVASIILALSPPSSFIVLCALGAIVGSCMVPMYALGLSRMVDALSASDTIRVTTVGLIAYNTGAFIGPVLAGLVMEMTGPGGLYAWISLAALAACIAAVVDTYAPVCCPEQMA